MRDNVHSSSDEASPLLGSSRPRPGHRRFTSLASITSVHIPQVHKKATILNLLSLVISLAAAAGGFLQLPQAQIVEDILCHQYYDEMGSLYTPIDDDLCKIEAISAELAFTLAIVSALSAGVGLLATFPWSFVADRYGRKPVLCLALVGLTLGGLWTSMVLWFRTVLPLRLIYLECLFSLIGGGNPIVLGLLFSMITDTTNEEERAVVFMRMHVASLVGNLLAPTISSLLMARYGPWLPICIGFSLIASSAIVVLFIPETLPVKPTAPEPEPEQSPTLRSRISHLSARLKSALTLSRSPSLILLFITCLVGMPVNFSTSTFMPVFMSARYHIKLLEGGYVQSAFGAAQIPVLFLLMPWLSRTLMKLPTSTAMRPTDEHHRDIVIARGCATMTLLAAVVLGLAPAIPVFLFGLALLALGSATFSLIRSLMSLYVDPKHRSRLFGLVGMVEIVGQIYAQPMLAELFALGMRLGGGWIGLPYFGLAMLMALVTVLLFFVRVSSKVKEPEEQEDVHG